MLLLLLSRFHFNFVDNRGNSAKIIYSNEESERYSYFFKGSEDTDAPVLVASTTDDVSQSELMMVESEIKKSTQVRKHYNKIITQTIKTEETQNEEGKGWEYNF